MERYICIHGHFYQPPRENPWLESIEFQDSAYPYHDWNERVTAECYEPNSASRIVDGENRIIEIVNNYARISFNFGPTLLSWMAEHETALLNAILEADRQSRERFSGHGSALAQPYNHMIMPLAHPRDQRTQVIWGIRDFQHRFGRSPEGMWLPETAVDLPTLEVLAEHDIRFTILSPHQAARIRRKGARHWVDVSGGRIDPRMAYEVRLPSGRTLALFFYHAPISRAVAFERLLSRGESLVDRLMAAFSDRPPGPELVHIATDGETYGHHHKFGDMALAYAIRRIESEGLARITNYGEYLEAHPPSHEVTIIEDTSWSCPHGIERWRSDCGCRLGEHPGWNQAWRAPLRKAFDWLRDTLAPRYEAAAGSLFKDPWGARDEYISVVLDRSPDSLERFFADEAAHPLSAEEQVRALKLLEMQRQAMLMYTSCGWYFDDLAGIEAVQNLRYAGRAVQLAGELFGDAVESQFLERLAEARSNDPREGDGRMIYERYVKPAMVDLPRVAAHYAICSLFESYGPQTRIHCYDVHAEDYRINDCGGTRLAIGHARVSSRVTLESATLAFAALHIGDQTVRAGVAPFPGPKSYEEMREALAAACDVGAPERTLALMEKHFSGALYTIATLFRDEQRRVLGRITEATLLEVEAALRRIYERYYRLIRFLADLGNPLPEALHSVAELMVTDGLRRALGAETVDPRRVRALLDEARRWRASIDSQGLGHLFKQNLKRMMRELSADPENLSLLERLTTAAGTIPLLPFDVNVWKVQNAYWEMMHTVLPRMRRRAAAGEETAARWVTAFTALGRSLRIRVEEGT